MPVKSRIATLVLCLASAFAFAATSPPHSLTEYVLECVIRRDGAVIATPRLALRADANEALISQSGAAGYTLAVRATAAAAPHLASQNAVKLDMSLDAGGNRSGPLTIVAVPGTAASLGRGAMTIEVLLVERARASHLSAGLTP